MKTIIVFDMTYEFFVNRKLTMSVEDSVTLTEESAVDLLIDSGYIERDEDFEKTVDFFRDLEDVISNEHAYTFRFDDSAVTLMIV